MIKNDYLKGIIKDLNKKISRLKNEQRESEIESQKIKFFGKILAGKLKPNRVLFSEKISQTNASTKIRDVSQNNHSTSSLWTNITDISKM